MYRIQTIGEISGAYRGILSESEYEVGAGVRDPHAIILRSADLHGANLPETLLAVGRAGVGVNNIPVQALGERGVAVFNSPGANANAVKELAVAALILASRDILGGIEWCKTLRGAGGGIAAEVERGKGRFAGPEILGKTLGVIGLGGVGGAVANAGHALQMRVVGVDPYISVKSAWLLSRAIEQMGSREELLAASDYVSVHATLTEETRGMINREALRRMKPGAALINLSRGELVEEAAVIDALRSGRLRRYVTDFPSEALIGEPGVIAIPHLGASTPESEDNCVAMIARQLDGYLKRGAVANSVNYPDCEPERGDRHLVTVMHANVPNVVSSVAGLVAGGGINIDSMQNMSKGAFAYTALNLDDAPREGLIVELSLLPTVYRVRVITR